MYILNLKGPFFLDRAYSHYQPYLEEKPLPEAMGIGILPHVEPIFSTAHPHSSIEVAALKLAIENDIFSPVIFFGLCGWIEL